MISLHSAQIQATVSKRQQMNPVRMTMLPPFTVRRCPPLTVYFFVNRDELPKKCMSFCYSCPSVITNKHCELLICILVNSSQCFLSNLLGFLIWSFPLCVISQGWLVYSLSFCLFLSPNICPKNIKLD